MNRQTLLACLVSVAAMFAASVVVSPSARASPAVKWTFHAGDALLASLNPSFSPVVAKSSANGHTLALMGTGKYSPGGLVSGSGVFWHNRSDGSLVHPGTWTADAVLSYEDFGNRIVDGVPRSFHGRVLVFAVTLTTDDRLGIVVDVAVNVPFVIRGNVPPGL